MFDKRLPWWPYRVLEWGCLVLALLVIAALLFPLFVNQRHERRPPNCMSHQTQIMWGMLSYAADHDERFPNALTWTSDVQVKHDAILTCPSDKRDNVFDYSMYLSYDMLQRWSGQKPLDGNRAAYAVFLYEVGSRGLEYRHNSGMNIAYMDGHVKWRPASHLGANAILSGFDRETAEILTKNAAQMEREKRLGQ